VIHKSQIAVELYIVEVNKKVAVYIENKKDELHQKVSKGQPLRYLRNIPTQQNKKQSSFFSLGEVGYMKHLIP
jgi:hypothetical protein